MPYIKNDTQMRKAMAPVIKGLTEFLLDKIFSLNKEKIQEIVYNVYNPTTYNRTGQFKEAWKTEITKTTRNQVEGKFSYAPEKMTYNQLEAQHGSYYQPPGDVREYLADIIYQGLSGPAFGNGPINGPWAEARDAFSALLDSTDGQFDQWVREGLSKLGDFRVQ